MSSSPSPTPEKSSSPVTNADAAGARPADTPAPRSGATDAASDRPAATPAHRKDTTDAATDRAPRSGGTDAVTDPAPRGDATDSVTDPALRSGATDSVTDRARRSDATSAANDRTAAAPVARSDASDAANNRTAATPAPRSDTTDTANDRTAATTAATDRRAVVAREKERYGGIKWGSAFFGWLTATGTAVILTALLAAAGATVGVATGTDAGDAQRAAATIGLVGGLTLLAVILVAYFCGGYVAGRMARFNGVKQGLAVWIWAVVIAAVVAVGGAVLGDKYDLLDRIGGFPRLPIGGDNVTTGSVIAVAIAVVAALVGAVLGGLAGMRFHRKVDRAGLGR